MFKKEENYMEENKENTIIVKEKSYQISESRIKYAISEFSKVKPIKDLIIISTGAIISFLIAFSSFYDTDSFWKYIFLVLLIIFTLAFITCWIILIVQKKIGNNSPKWFFEEITGTHPNKIKSTKHIDKRKLLFIIINTTLILGLPTLVILLVFGLNNWYIWDKNWWPQFMAVWFIATLMYITFGTFINSTFSSLLFGYDFLEKDNDF